MNLSLRVYGTPKGQPRPRAFARKFGNTFAARVYDSGTAEGWKGDVALAVRPHMPAIPIGGEVGVEMLFLFPRPSRLTKKKSPTYRIPHLAKPDVDNLSKAVLDCFVRVGVLTDDAIVYDIRVLKFYVAVGERPGAEIVIRTVDPCPACARPSGPISVTLGPIEKLAPAGAGLLAGGAAR